MKKFKLVACAAAAAAMFAGSAQAVDIDGRTGAAAANAYASELVTNGTTAITGIEVVNRLGFGVSEAQTRYIRYDLTNALFAGAVNPANVVLDDGAGGGAALSTVVSQGGGAGSAFVILQITADTGGNEETDDVTFAMPDITVTSKASAASIKYSLYETAADAAAGGAAGLLEDFSDNIATFQSGVAFSVTTNTTTADVTTLYKNFRTTGSGAGESNVLAKIGDVTYGVNTAVYDPADGAALDFSDIGQFIDTGSKIVLEGADLSAAAGLYLGDATGTCAANSGTNTAATNVTATTADFVIDANEVLDRPLCFTANGTAAIVAQTFTARVDVVPVGSTGTADTAALTVGNFDRDGTVLRAAFAETPAGSFSGTINLMNTSSNVANFTTRCFTNAVGTAGVVDGLGGTVPANQGARFGIGSASGLNCPANTRGVELTFSVPQGSVIGSVVRQDATTGQASFDGMVGNSISSDATP